MKRFLSAILSVMMLVSLLPSVAPMVAIAAETPVSVTYSFVAGGRSDISATYTTNLEANNGAWQSLYKAFPSNPQKDGDNWAYLGSTISSGYNASQMVTVRTYIGTGFSSNANEWLAFKIKVPKTATYMLENLGAYMYGNATSKVEAYIFPMDESKFYEGSSIYGTTASATRTGQTLFPDLGITDATLMGTGALNAGSDVIQSVALSDLGTVALEKDKEYVFLLNNTVAGKVITITEATLKEVKEGYVPSPVVKVDFTTFDITGSTDVEADLKGDNWVTVPEESTLRANAANQYVRESVAKWPREKAACVTVQNGYAEWTDNANSKWTIEVDMGTKNEGWYDIKLLGAQVSSACEYYIYVDGQYAGIYNFNGSYAEGGFILSEKALNSLYLTPDENEKVKISFAYAGSGNKEKEEWISRMYVNSITLTPNETYEEPTFEKIVENIPSEIFAGESLEISAYAEMSDGKAYHASEFNADHSKNENYGVNVEILSDESGILALTPTNAYGVYYMPETGGNGNHTSFDGAYEGVISAVGEGTATVRVSAHIGGEVYTKDVTVTAKEGEALPVTYEFSSATINSNGAYGKAPQEWPILATNWSIVGDKTTTSPTNTVYAKYMTIQMYLTSTSTLGWHEVAAENRRPFQFVIRGRVFKEGWYSVSMQGHKFNGEGGSTFLYVDGQYAGHYDFMGDAETGGKLGEDKKMNTIYITPENGYIEVMMAKSIGYKNADGVKTANVNPYRITLTPVEFEGEALSYNDVSATLPEKVYIGEEAPATFRATLSDGSDMHINGYDASGEADNSSSITATADDEFVKITDLRVVDGEVVASLDGIKEGTGKITVSGKYKGNDFSKEFEVPVKPIPKLSEVIVSFDKAEIPATRTTNTKIELIRDDGAPYTGEYTVVYESLNTDVATVDAASGEVTGISAGKAKIKVEATAPDATAFGEAEITIGAKPVLSEISPAVRKNYLIGSTAKIRVSGKMDDGIDADMGEYTLSFESSDPDIIKVDNEGNVEALAIGTATITVTAAKEGESVSVTLPLEVFNTLPSTIFDFSGVSASSSDVENEVKSTNWRTIPDESNLYANAAYQTVYTSGTLKACNITIASYSSGGQYKWVDARGETSKFTIEADLGTTEAGHYDIFLNGANVREAGEFYVYVDGKYAGIYNFNGTAQVNNFALTEKKLNTLYLEPDENGKVKIMFAYAGAGTKDSEHWLARMYINSLTLTPNPDYNGYDEISVVTNIPEVMAVGEALDVSAYLELSDGTRLSLNGYTAEREEDNNNNLKVEIVSDGDGALEITKTSDFGIFYTPTGGRGNHTEYDGIYKASISAKKAGNAEIKISGAVNGETVEKTITVEIADDPLVSTSAKISAEELFAGDSCTLIAQPKLQSGRVTDSASVITTYKSLNEDIVTVEGNTLTTIKEGEAQIEVTSTFNGVTKAGYITVTVQPEGMTSIEITAGGSEYIRLTDKENDTTPLYVKAISNLGRELDMTGAEITAIALNPEYADIDENLNIIPVAINPETQKGDATFRVTVKTADGRVRTAEKTLTVVVGKSRRSYFTDDLLTAVRANVKKYDWVKAASVSYMDRADYYADNAEKIYDLIVSEGLPRINSVGTEADHQRKYCHYCRKNLQEEYGTYPWLHNALVRPWKIQCPDCKRQFPSNDFGSFYKLGLNEYGEFERELALNNHRAMLLEMGLIDTTVEEPGEVYSDDWYAYYGYGVKGGYLYNELYQNLENEKNPANPEEPFLRPGEKTATWAVDDGEGYVPKKEDGTPYMLQGRNQEIPERHCYIPEYLFHGLWRKADTNGGLVATAISTLTYAYYYTGEAKYGRALAILVDRVADFNADYDMTKWDYETWRSSDTCQGMLLDHVWSNGPVQAFARGYDMAYEFYDDQYVIDFIKKKGETLKFRNAKNTPSQIRTSVEDGVLRASLDALTGQTSYIKGRVNVAGNFGYPQRTNALLAVILDTFPDTAKWIDFIMAPGWSASYNCTGGGVEEKLINDVCHDGLGNEGSSYNVAWHTSLIQVADVLAAYDAYQVGSFYNFPKFVQMFYSLIPMMGAYTPEIGDSNYTASNTQWITSDIARAGWVNLKDPVFAQILYNLNGNSAKGLHYDETHPDPEALSREVEAVVREYGVLSTESEMMTGFGFAALRDGGDWSKGNISTGDDVRRDIWMYFGTNDGHGHYDTLNLGMTAYGLNFLPDLGYPTKTGMDPNRLQWVGSTLSHNTVIVNEKNQDISYVRGKSLHFDDSGNVGVMDVDAKDVYRNNVETYRRSAIMISVDDETSYTVDFFRVKGGNDHLFSFHASSDEIAETTGLDLVPQADESGNYVGSYAGRDVPYGPDPNSPQQWWYDTVYPRGYTWLDKVDRDETPDEKFEIDFKIKDFNRVIKDSTGLRLRMTMLDSGNRDGRKISVSTANGYPPNKVENKNIPSLRYVLVKHTGEDLDTTFTTVYEPYRNERYLSDISELPMTVKSGSEGELDASKAVKVTFENGRVDYVLWATNNSVTYEIELENGEKLSFRGFVGVWTVQNGEVTYKYLHDGDILGNETSTASVEGVITGFTKEQAFENEIRFRPSASVSEQMAEDIAGKYIVIENDGVLNSAYKIESAELSGNDVVLDIGSKTIIRKFVNSAKPEQGYVYNIAEGQSARIPLTYVDNGAPVFNPMSDVTGSAGSLMTFKVEAVSPLEGKTVEYEEVKLPRGASLSQDGTITWKPADSQLGENHFAITARDSDGRESTLHFDVRIYGSTSGGGGGGTTAPSNKPSTDVGEDIILPPAEPDVRFTDLGNHAWAADAINSLADKGIIKGTSETTYSPANNITRADFAILLVRAFEKESDNTENFADVSESDYFAKELAIARNTGLVGGIGANLFAPRDNIKRCDMMLMVYRVLKDKFVGADIIRPDYEDFDSVPDYAKEAVSALIGAGLVNGKNNLIAPNDNTTRAEVAVLLQRVLEFVENRAE